MNKQIIGEYIANNKMLSQAINNIVDENEYLDDFRSYIFLQIMETNESKLISLYEKGQLDWFCLKVMVNQWRSKTSNFYKVYRNKGFGYNNIMLSENDANIDIEDITEEYHEDKYNTYCLDEVKERITYLLAIQYDDFMANQYHKTLFEMYYYEKKKLREISNETGIKIMSINRSVRRTKEYLKNNLEI